MRRGWQHHRKQPNRTQQQRSRQNHGVCITQPEGPWLPKKTTNSLIYIDFLACLGRRPLLNASGDAGHFRSLLDRTGFSLSIQLSSFLKLVSYKAVGSHALAALAEV